MTGSRSSRRRALSEEALRRKTTFDECFDVDSDLPQSEKKRRRLHENPMGNRSISEVLPVVAKSLLSDMSDTLPSQQSSGKFSEDRGPPDTPLGTQNALSQQTTPLDATAASTATTTTTTASAAPSTADRLSRSPNREASNKSCGEDVRKAEGAAACGVVSAAASIAALPNETDEERDARSRCVYIDRISIDVTDAMIKQAIGDHILPQGVNKVQSLEVIRTQKSRHVHAFAILTQTMTEEGILDVPVSCGEYIKVQRAVKQLQLPPPPKVCRTLHVRIYARRSGWGEAVRRMTWTGLLCMLDFVSAGITDKIDMIADDRSSKSLASHPDNLCCVFFAECATEEDAKAVHEAVHDKTTKGLGDVVFLVRTDYAKGEKKLHDTSVNLEQLREKYNTAKEYARTAASYRGSSWEVCDGKDCPIPEALRLHHKKGVHDCFEFGSKHASPRKAKGKKAKEAAKSPDKAAAATDPQSDESRVLPAFDSSARAVGNTCAEESGMFMLPRDPSEIHLAMPGGDDPWSYGRAPACGRHAQSQSAQWLEQQAPLPIQTCFVDPRSRFSAPDEIMHYAPPAPAYTTSYSY
ncbi:hypothetical protein DIPPA_08152 [Diplonema papillatum]|nr:hypothetical protein DIPPA_17528 [Diplonema papillatum]KAJ9441869.1 hypothetical protein DIPPA_08152 [Diplonema papillatum]